MEKDMNREVEDFLSRTSTTSVSITPAIGTVLTTPSTSELGSELVYTGDTIRYDPPRPTVVGSAILPGSSYFAAAEDAVNAAKYVEIKKIWDAMKINTMCDPVSTLYPIGHIELTPETFAEFPRRIIEETASTIIKVIKNAPYREGPTSINDIIVDHIIDLIKESFLTEPDK